MLMSSRDEGDRYSRKYGALFLLRGTISDTIITILHLADSVSVCTQQIITPSTYSSNNAFKSRGRNRSGAVAFKAWKTCLLQFFFYVLLTVHLIILVINQLNAQILVL